MTVGGCGYVLTYGETTTPTVPWLPGDEPDRAPTQPGEQGEEWLIAVGRFPSSEVRGVLWGARIESFSDRARTAGPKEIRVTAPCTPATMRLLGDAQTGEFDQFGRQLYNMDDAISFEVLLGSTIDGLVRHRFVVRGEVEVSGGEVSFTATGFVGGLTADRIIGAPTRYNLLRNNASFEHGDLRGWALVVLDSGGMHRLHGVAGTTSLSYGSGSAVIKRDGVDGAYCVEIKGRPGFCWLESRAPYSQPERPWGRQRIAATASVKLPASRLIDIEDYRLVSVRVETPDVLLYPNDKYGDTEAGLVASDMARGSWLKSAVSGVGYLPVPPYTVDVVACLHALDEDNGTRYDDGQIIRREATTTVTAKDLVQHTEALFRHAQEPGRPGYKSPWGIKVVEGEPTGISEVGTWWHPDGQSMNDALEALCGRGMDVWDLPGPGRLVKSAKRRGSVRSDLMIHPHDVLGRVAWRTDPGAQRTAVRAVSAAGTIWGGADEGATDTSHAGGQVIDVIVSGPVGMTPNQLKAWAADQLASLAVLQSTATILVSWRLGMRIGVGDTIKVGLTDGVAAKVDWMRVTEWTPAPGRKFVALALGTDPEIGGA